ncbi:MAG: chemotaxis response regulator protein-glutamate methylesterase [Acidobacteriota bacterium]
MIKVLIVDDSAIVRKVLTEELSKHPDIEVVGSAVDPYVARDKILQLDPDVLTLDIEMPRMDGLTFLYHLMRQYPLPVVVLSSLTPRNSEMALRALRLGAVEVIPKPDSRYSVPDGRFLAEVIRAAARAKVGRPRGAEEDSDGEKSARAAEEVAREAVAELGTLTTTHRVIALGASTGGTTTLEEILRQFPPIAPGTVIVQHMPENFTRLFAERLDSVCKVRVREAVDLDPVVPGTVLVAPGGRHMTLERSGAQYRVRLKDGPRVHFQKPSVDVLFFSVAKAAGHNAVGALLTGMGADGAKGLLAMKEAGAHTIAQNEATCVVYGMPREAVRLGAASEILPLDRIAGALLKAAARPREKQSEVVEAKP